MNRSGHSTSVFYACLLVGGLALLLFLQFRLPNIPKSAGSPQALAPDGQSATPMPAGSASARGGQTSIRSAHFAPDTPGSLNNLPPPLPRESFGEAEEPEEHVESNLTEEEYEAAIEDALALPPDPSLTSAIGALATGPTFSTNFNGLDIADCCGSPGSFFIWPPDPDIAVGRNHIVVAVNSAFAVYNKTGTKQGSTVNAYSFWSTAGGGCGTIANDPAGSLFDPFVSYDPGADRFIVGFDAKMETADGAATDESYLCIAISPVGDPTAAAGSWYRYSTDVKENISGDDYWLDYPHIGVWYNGIYVTGNYFRFSDDLSLYSSIYAFDKTDMYANATADVRIIDGVLDAYAYSVFTVQPVKASYTYPGSGPAYFLNSDCLVFVTPCDGAELNVYTMTVDFAGTGTAFALAENLAVTSYGYAVDVSQSGTTDKVQAGDVRLLDAQWHTNGTVYASHTMGCNPGSGTVDCVRWYQVGNLSGAPTLLQQGTISSSGKYRFFPDLAVDRSGNMAIAYSHSSSSDFIGIRFTGRLAGDSSGTTATDSTFKTGEAVYTNTVANESSPRRWGDYTGMVVDPVDGCTLWYVGEYAKTRAYPDGPNWGTRIGQLYFNPCLTVGVSPSVVMENAANPAATGTVSRGAAALGSPLTVNISSSLPLTVTVPATAIIPSSQISTTFPITAVNNALLGPYFLNATITVTATNYISGTASITVLDDETTNLIFLPLVMK